MHDLTAFAVDCLAALAALDDDEPCGRDIIRWLNDELPHYDSINHGRLYPNLDKLEQDGFIRKEAMKHNRRSNVYRLTDDGWDELDARNDLLSEVLQ